MSENTASLYDADYYLHGQESGKSLYRNYRWLPDLTLPMVHWITSHLGIQRCDSILDFGCARGYVVKALREFGYDAWGVDHAEWPIENADPDVREYVARASVPPRDFDWIIAKDVLEHIPDGPLQSVLSAFAAHARRGFLIVVPLSPESGEPYAVPEYEKDVTHVQRMTLEEWGRLVSDLAGDSFAVSWGYRMPGLKDNYAHHEHGNGFLIGRRWKA